LLREVRACAICAAHLPTGPRPIVQVDSRARILIAGQAPGRRVHETGIPFNDASGDRLRQWLGIDRDTFYNPANVAILPMGFCYPGSGRSGDLPPRPECAPAWREALLEQLTSLELTLIIGQYAQAWHLGSGTLGVTETRPQLADPMASSTAAPSSQPAQWNLDSKAPVVRTGRLAGSEDTGRAHPASTVRRSR
jgi:uracil-DNA glycosylase